MESSMSTHNTHNLFPQSFIRCPLLAVRTKNFVAGQRVNLRPMLGW
jgi:hypothetical protein